MKKLMFVAGLCLAGMAGAQETTENTRPAEPSIVQGELWNVSFKIDGKNEHDTVCLNKLNGFIDTFSIPKILDLESYLKYPNNICTDALKTVTTKDKTEYKLDTVCSLPNRDALAETHFSKATDLNLQTSTSITLDKNTNIAVGKIMLDYQYKVEGDSKVHRLEKINKPEVTFVLVKQSPAQACKVLFNDLSEINVTNYELSN